MVIVPTKAKLIIVAVILMAAIFYDGSFFDKQSITVTNPECSQGQTQCVTTTKYNKCLANGQWSGLLTCASGLTCNFNKCGGTAPAPTPTPTPSPTPTVCALDTYLCPDGSYVNRVLPSCNFAACPATTPPPGMTCSPGATQCVDVNSYRQCLTTGVWSGGKLCDVGNTCINNVCSGPSGSPSPSPSPSPTPTPKPRNAFGCTAAIAS